MVAIAAWLARTPRLVSHGDRGSIPDASSLFSSRLLWMNGHREAGVVMNDGCAVTLKHWSLLTVWGELNDTLTGIVQYNNENLF